MMTGLENYVRFPLIRSPDDNTPFAWWEWLFFPFFWAIGVSLFPLLLILCIFAIPYFWIYPDCHATDYDTGTEKQRHKIRRYRRFAAQVSFWRRAGRVLIYPLRHALSRRWLRASKGTPYIKACHPCHPAAMPGYHLVSPGPRRGRLTCPFFRSSWYDYL
jgi:hypothetical protein